MKFLLVIPVSNSLEISLSSTSLVKKGCLNQGFPFQLAIIFNAKTFPAFVEPIHRDMVAVKFLSFYDMLLSFDGTKVL